MKKFISTAIAFIITWAVTFGAICLFAYMSGFRDPSGWRLYLPIAFAGALGGLFGPMISNRLFRRPKKS